MLKHAPEQFPEKTDTPHTISVEYWWTQEIVDLRKKAHKAKRFYLRPHNLPSKDER